MTPGLPLAFLAGVLSFLSPCVLPLVPTYLAYVGGGAGGSAGGGSLRLAARRAVVIRNAVTFTLGFGLVFVALGASASALGGLLRAWRGPLTLAGGVVVIVLGLAMLGVVRLPWLYRDTRPRVGADTDLARPWGALLLGMAFAAGWTPCIGPVLGGILTLAAQEGTLARGAGLLAVYSLGLALPFWAAALAFEPFLRLSARLRGALPWFERAAGGLLVLAGLLMLTGTYTRLNAALIRVTPEWLLSRL